MLNLASTADSRRVLSIAAIPSTNEHSNGVAALRSDGTIWHTYFVFDKNAWSGWEKLPEIPECGSRVLSIAAIPSAHEHSNGVIALCEDGSIWTNYFIGKMAEWNGWERLPALPDDGGAL